MIENNGIKFTISAALPCVLSLAVICATPSTVAGQSGPKPNSASASKIKGDKVIIDFNEADIKVFIKFMAELTGRNIIIDEKVKGKVTIISPREVTKEEAIKVFESTLEVYGYSMIKAGDVTKIIPATEARQRGAFESGPSQPGDKIMTRLIQLHYVKADELVNTLRPLIPISSYITSFKGTNTLILVDYASNMGKVMSIIAKLDVPGQEEIVTVVRLEHAGAKEMADRLTKIYGEKSQGAQPAGRRVPAPPPGSRSPAAPGAGWSVRAQVIPDERINAIIIVANKTLTDRLRGLISQLDVPAMPGQGKINVYYLKNADAEELAKVLNNITKTRPKRGPKRGGPVKGVKLESRVIVTPDKSSNALVITASKEDYATLYDVIQKLDKRKKQVFVEALIMEITSDKTREFGVEWRTTSDFTNSGAQGIGGTNFGNINAVAESPLNAPQGLTIGVVDGIINFGGVEFLNLGALVHALQSESGINILSTPNILTTDNKEAEIVVAQNVPFISGESQTSGGNTITTVERKNIGITLRITPQISESDIVKLDVYQEISSISNTQLDKAKDLITFTRSIKTSVVVRDAQNIVIGGLIRDDLNEVENKVPFLGDLPLLGWLFKSVSKQKQKTNLLVFLTPHIINSDVDIKEITDRQNKILRMNPSSSMSEFGSAVTKKAGKKESYEQKEKPTWGENDTFDQEEDF